MHKGIATTVSSVGKILSEFSVPVVLHQGLVSHPNLFTMILNKLTKKINDEVSWCILLVLSWLMRSNKA